MIVGANGLMAKLRPNGQNATNNLIPRFPNINHAILSTYCAQG
jgi:hypothetical protein